MKKIANILLSLEECVPYFSFNPLYIIPPIVISLFLLYKWTSMCSVSKKKLPPSPPRLLIIGNLHKIGLHPHRSLRALSQEYGDLMLLWLGSKPVILISSAEAASLVLKTHDLVFASRPRISALTRLFLNGKDVIASTYREYWRKMRSICVYRLLSNAKVRSYRKLREEELALMVESIRMSSVVNMSEVFISPTNDLICRVAFGKTYRVEESGIDFEKLIDEFSKLIGSYFVGDFIPWLAWVDYVNGVDAKLRKVATTFDGVLERILQEHSDGGRDKNENGAEKDFVNVLLEIQREDGSGNPQLDRESIKGLILRDMFVAATDTTYVVLEWMMAELIRNPKIMKKLQRELRGIIGDRGVASEEDLENMNYMKAMIKETLRLHPPLPLLLPHECTDDVKLNGYDIASGTQVLINVWLICQDQRYWEEPERFYPERFTESQVDFKGQDFEFFPFGSGRRICPGITFAVIEMELVMANLMHQFEWALPEGAAGESLDMTEAPGIAVHKKEPLFVVPTPRI